jgi:MFS family permease
MSRKPASANRTLIIAILALACCNTAIGIMVQMIPLNMEGSGLSARLIGLNTAMGQLGVFICGLLLPAATRLVSSKALVLLAMGVLVVTMLLFSATDPLWWWFVVRFANGFGIAAMFTLSETWITVAAGNERRARVMGIYTTILTTTFGVGPFVVAGLGFESILPWLIAAACLLPGLISTFFVEAENHLAGDKGGSFMSILRQAPTLYICILATTTFEAITLSFFTIYGMRSGLPLATANYVLGVGIIGCVGFFYLTGHLADRWSRNGTALICCGAALLFSIITAFTITHPAIWPVTVLLRAGAFGVYIVAITTIGDSFTGNKLVSATALVAMAWGVGGMAGPPLAGFLIDQIGIAVLPWCMAACYAVALVSLMLNGWRIQPMDKRPSIAASTHA